MKKLFYKILIGLLISTNLLFGYGVNIPQVQAAGPTRIFLTTTGAGNWTVPSDWNNASNTIEVLGGGAGGYGAYASGGGGAYSKISNKTLTSGASIPFSVGSGGIGALNGDGNANTYGGDTWFGNSVYASAYVAAKGAAVASNNGGDRGGYGGLASGGIGDVKYSGGDGGNSYNTYMGGGGSAGPHGNGSYPLYSDHSQNGWGGAADAGNTPGIYAGTGNSGTQWDSTHGCGSGGGWGGFPVGNGLNGGNYGGGATFAYNGYRGGYGIQGIIVITYTPAVKANFNFFFFF